MMSVMKRLPHEERRLRIVQSAMGAFAKTGFKGTRTKDLALAAGISEALLFKFFPTKRALQKAIIEHRLHQAGEFLSPALLQAAPAEALNAIASRYFSMSNQDPSFMRLLLFSGLEGEPLAPMFFRRRVAGNIEVLSGLFRLWQKRGWVRRALDARLAAWSFMCMVAQAMISRHIFRVRRMEDRPGDLAAKMVDIFLSGVRP